MKVAVERRGDHWMAQIVYIGRNLHWSEHNKIQNDIIAWIKENDLSCIKQDGWQFYFAYKKDAEWFMLKWSV